MKNLYFSNVNFVMHPNQGDDNKMSSRVFLLQKVPLSCAKLSEQNRDEFSTRIWLSPFVRRFSHSSDFMRRACLIYTESCWFVLHKNLLKSCHVKCTSIK